MPKCIVEITWDTPDYKEWLPPDNIALALHAYCENTNFKVRRYDPHEVVTKMNPRQTSEEIDELLQSKVAG